MRKLVVTVAPTSNFHGKDANPALPFTPQEAADSVYDCWNAGASVVHLHGRDSNGLPTNDPAWFQETDELIRAKGCDIVIQHSMAPANPALLGQEAGDVDDGLRTVTTDPPPEMASLEVSPTNIIWNGRTYNMLWDRLWAESAANMLREKGIKPEVEVYNNSDLDDIEYLIAQGALEKPYYISFVLGMHRVNNQASRYSPRHLMHLVDLLPADAIFSVLGIGTVEWDATTQSILLGGNVRVGFEDNIYIEKGRLALSNAECVAKIVRIARDLGREIANPAETRETLGIKQLGT